jgi:hypothetical protein
MILFFGYLLISSEGQYLEEVIGVNYQIWNNGAYGSTSVVYLTPLNNSRIYLVSELTIFDLTPPSFAIFDIYSDDALVFFAKTQQLAVTDRYSGAVYWYGPDPDYQDILAGGFSGWDGSKFFFLQKNGSVWLYMLNDDSYNLTLFLRTPISTNLTGPFVMMSQVNYNLGMIVGNELIICNVLTKRIMLRTNMTSSLGASVSFEVKSTMLDWNYTNYVLIFANQTYYWCHLNETTGYLKVISTLPLQFRDPSQILGPAFLYPKYASIISDSEGCTLNVFDITNGNIMSSQPLNYGIFSKCSSTNSLQYLLQYQY